MSSEEKSNKGRLYITFAGEDLTAEVTIHPGHPGTMWEEPTPDEIELNRLLRKDGSEFPIPEHYLDLDLIYNRLWKDYNED